MRRGARLRWIVRAGGAGLLATLLSVLSGYAGEPLTLKEAIRRAIENAPAAELAAAQSDLESARVRETAAANFPRINANGEYNQAPGYSKTITNSGLTQAGLALDYVAFDGGRRSNQVRAARYAAQAAALGVDVARAQIVFETTVAYFDLAHTHAVASELERSVARLNEYLAIVENLRGSGRAIASDVLKVRVTRDATQLNLATTNQAVAHAAIVLGALIGAEGSDGRLELAEVPGLPPPPSGDVSLSPVYRAAQRRLASAGAGVAAARAERAPTFNLALTSGWEGINPAHTFNRNLGASYDGMVSVPIFTGGLVRAHIDEARATEHLALAQIHATQLVLKRDLADALARYQGARHQLEILAQAQTTADDAFALVWTRFLGGGSATLLEVTDAYQSAESLRTAQLDNEFAVRQAAAQAALILGVER